MFVANMDRVPLVRQLFDSFDDSEFVYRHELLQAASLVLRIPMSLSIDRRRHAQHVSVDANSRQCEPHSFGKEVRRDEMDGII